MENLRKQLDSSLNINLVTLPLSITPFLSFSYSHSSFFPYTSLCIHLNKTTIKHVGHILCEIIHFMHIYMLFISYGANKKQTRHLDNFCIFLSLGTVWAVCWQHTRSDLYCNFGLENEGTGQKFLFEICAPMS